jgi:GNAT superfamily N-acetyltransferase
MKEPLIRLLEAKDSFQELTQLVNVAYRPLAEMGFRFVASYQDCELTIRRCAIGDTYVAEMDGNIIGCITLRPPQYQMAGIDDYPAWYERNDVAVFGQFAVHPDLQKNGIGTKLILQAEERATDLGANEIACDTAEGVTHLISYYE